MAATELNPSQKAAVYSDAKNILCLAGAGTGKTYCMIERILRLVSSDVDPTSILVLTFTNAAAFEMKQRYLAKISSGRIPEFRTFHSFCYHLISTDAKIRQCLGYSQIPVVIDKERFKQIEISVKNSTGISLPAKLSSADRNKLSKQDRFKLNTYEKAVTSKLRAENLITFGTLCREVCKLFISDSPLVSKYKVMYTYLFVDEFQDTDPIQFDFVSSFQHAHHFYVGDPSQAIYGFRNADSSIIKRLACDKNWSVIKLFENYRSTQEICDYANEIIDSTNPEYKINLHSTKTGSMVHQIPLSQACTDSTTGLNVLECITSDVFKHEGSTAILARTNSECSEVVKYLQKCNLKCKVGHPDENAVNVINCVCDNDAFLNWVGTYLRSEQYAEYCRLVLITESDHQYPSDLEKTDARLQLLISTFYNRNFNVRKSVDMVRSVRNSVISLGPKSTKSQVIREICKILNLGQLLNLIDEQSEEISKLRTLKDALSWIKDKIASTNDSSIYVGTIHSSKGLEYDNVYLIGVNSNVFKLNKEENINLYYVGATRAKSTLTVFKYS